MIKTKPNPLDLGARCESCPFSLNKKPRPDYVLGEIPENCTGLLIGESPGHEDSALGRSFGGNTGRMLDETLSQAGLKRSELGVVTATCCKPGPLDGPDARAKAAQCCKPALMKQIENHKDKPKLLMGLNAASQFTKIVKGGIEVMRGFVRKEIQTIVTWNPSYAYYSDPYQWAVFDTDVQRFARLIAGKLEAGPTRIVTKPTHHDLRTLVEGSGGVVAVDIETAPVDQDRPWTGKDSREAVLRSIQFGTETEAISFLWEEADFELQQETKRVLENSEIVKVWCNGFWFDLRVLRRYGMESVNNEDIRDMRKALVSYGKGKVLSLRYIASLYCDIVPWKELGMDDSEK